MENLEPWQGQLMVPSLTVETRHWAWVQTAEKALNSPSSGWVTTTFRSLKIVPPPTGMSLVAASSSPPGEASGEVPGDAVSDAVGVPLASPPPPSSPDDPQPVTRAAAPAAPAVRTVLRRAFMGSPVVET